MFIYLLLNIYSCNAYFNTKSKPPDSLLTPPPCFCTFTPTAPTGNARCKYKHG